MGSTTQRSRPTENLERSNSTASLFLGAPRKEWMASSSVSGPSGPPRPVGSDPDRSEPALISPVEPGEPLQSTRPADPVPSKKPEAALPSPADSTRSPVIQQSPITSAVIAPIAQSEIAPSPAPTPTAPPHPLHPPQSDADAADGNGDGTHSTSTTGSTQTITSETLATTQAPPVPPATVIIPERTSQGSTTPSAQPESVQPAQEPTMPATTTSSAPSTPAKNPTAGIEQAVWNLWKKRCEHLMVKVKATQSLPIIEPRVKLMKDACKQKDIRYLVLHQLYCRYSLGDDIFQENPILNTPECRDGLQVVNQLLGGNGNVARELLTLFSRNPIAPELMKKESWYPGQVDELARFLTLLAQRFNPIHDIGNRGFPPLIHELKKEFQLKSPVLLSVLSSSICRRFYDEQFYSHLQDLFCQNLGIERTGKTKPALHQLIDQYRKIPMKQPFTSASPAVQYPSELSAPSPTASINSPQIAVQSQVRRASAPVHQTNPLRPHLATPTGLNPGATNIPPPTSHQSTPIMPNDPVLPLPPTAYAHSPYHGAVAYRYPSEQVQQLRQAQQEGSNSPRLPPPSPGQPAHPQIQAQLVQQQQAQQRAQQAQQQGLPAQQQAQQALQAQNQAQRQPQQAQQAQQQALQVHHQSQQGQQQQPPPQRWAMGPDGRFSPIFDVRTSAHYQTQGQPISSRPSPSPTGLPPHLQPGSHGHPSPVRSPARVNSLQQPQSPQSLLPHHPHSHPPQPQPQLSLQQIQPQLQPQMQSHPQIQPQFQSQPHSQPQPQLFTPLFPPPGYQLPHAAIPQPRVFGLHVIDLTDPMKQCVKSGPAGQFAETDLYFYLSDFATEPMIINKEKCSYVLKFNVSAEDVKRRPRYAGKNPSSTTALFQSGCVSYRLRCVALQPEQVQNAKTLWPTTVTTWPTVFYVHKDGKELTPRRKNYHGKDMPLDVTPSVKEGENKISIEILLGPEECVKTTYLFAVEILSTAGYPLVRSMVKAAQAETVRETIQKRLTQTTDDDDLAVVTENLTVSIICPFTAQVWKTPARSMHCFHQECFDLDMFISTRKCVTGPGPMNDNWQCPICHADARPQCLVVDRFLEDVRADLMQRNELEDAKAIQISRDGSWIVKVESQSKEAANKRKADKVCDEPSTKAPKTESSVTPTPTSTRTVIEID